MAAYTFRCAGCGDVTKAAEHRLPRSGCDGHHGGRHNWVRATAEEVGR